MPFHPGCLLRVGSGGSKPSRQNKNVFFIYSPSSANWECHWPCVMCSTYGHSNPFIPISIFVSCYCLFSGESGVFSSPPMGLLDNPPSPLSPADIINNGTSKTKNEDFIGSNPHYHLCCTFQPLNYFFFHGDSFGLDFQSLPNERTHRYQSIAG